MILAPELAPNTVLGGRYQLSRKIGNGGMGVVYEAFDLAGGNTRRAVKTLDARMAADPGIRVRFEREARIGAELRSPHVAAVFDSGFDPATGLPYLVMELLIGEELGARIARSGGLSPAEVRSILDQLCEAVAVAHARGIVHRDLKPNNVFVCHDGTVKVFDFGIAKVLAEFRATNSIALGTPGWVTPEQLEPNGRVGPWTDVWAIGLVAFHALTGRQYWIAANAAVDSWAAVCKEIYIGPLPPASARAAELGRPGAVPPALDPWFARCIARSPAERFPDAGACFRGLEQAFKVRLVKGGAPPAPISGVAGLDGDPSGSNPAPQVEVPSAPRPVIADDPEGARIEAASREIRARVDRALATMLQEAAAPMAPVAIPVGQPQPEARVSTVDVQVAQPSAPAPPSVRRVILPPDVDPPSPDTLRRVGRGPRRAAVVVPVVLALGIALAIGVVALDRGCSGPSGAPTQDALGPMPRVVTLASYQGAPASLAAALGRIYWVDEKAMSIGNVSQAGSDSASTILFSAERIGPMVADSDAIYWATPDAVFRRTSGATSSDRLYSAENVSSLALFKDTLYWAESRVGGAIRRGSKAGGATQATIVEGEDNVRDLAVDASTLFWTNEAGQVRSIARDGSGKGVSVVASGQDRLRGIALDEGFVYWLRGDGFARAPKPAGTSAGLPPRRASSLTVDDRYVYWTVEDRGEVMRAPKAEGAAEVIAQGQGAPVAIVDDARSLYWTDRTGTIRKQDKQGVN